MWKKVLKWAGISIGGLFALLIVISIVPTPEPTRTLEATPTSEPTPTPTPTPYFYAGDRARLFKEGVEGLFMTTDEASYKELLNAMKISDRLGIENMVIEGRLFMIDNDVQVLLLERGTTFFVTSHWKVRILEGTKRGIAGWVPHSLVSPLPADDSKP